VATNEAISRFEWLLLARFFWKVRMSMEGGPVDTSWPPSEIELVP
jgi:hypothetical protein